MISINQNIFSNILSTLTDLKVSSHPLAMNYSKKDGFSFNKIRQIKEEEINSFNKSAQEFIKLATKVKKSTDLKLLHTAMIACVRVCEVGMMTSKKARVFTHSAKNSIDKRKIITQEKRIQELNNLAEKLFYRMNGLICHFDLKNETEASKQQAQENTNFHPERAAEKFLFIALQTGNKKAALELIEAGIGLNTKDLPLVIASQSKDPEFEQIALRLIEKGANIHCKDKNGVNALYYACQMGHVRLALKLIELKIDIDCHTKHDDSTPLIQLLKTFSNWKHNRDEKNLKQLVTRLIEAGANLLTADTTGNTALMYALQNGFICILSLLVKAGSNVQIRDQTGQTTFHLLLNAFDITPQSSNKEIQPFVRLFNLFIDHGADIHQKSTFIDLDSDSDEELECTFLELILKRGFYQLVPHLIEVGVADSNEDDLLGTLFITADSPEISTVQKEGLEQSLCLLFDKEIETDVNRSLLLAFPSTVQPILYHALRLGFKNLAEKLMEMEATLHQVSEKEDHPEYYNTMLCAAAFGGLEEIALRFIKQKLPMPTSQLSKNCLIVAACKGMKKLTLQLLAMGFEIPEAASNFPEHLLKFASVHMITGRTNITYQDYLQAMGKKSNHPPQPSSALYNAICSDDEEFALFVLGKMQNIALDDWKLALEKKMQKLALKMSERIEQFDRFTGTHFSYLLLACKAGCEEVALSLINKGAPLNDLSHDGYSPMLLAQKQGFTKVIAALLQRAVPLNQSARSGYSSTHALFEAGQHEYFEQILRETQGKDLMSEIDGRLPVVCLVKSKYWEKDLEHTNRMQKAWETLFPETSLEGYEQVFGDSKPALRAALLMACIEQARQIAAELTKEEVQAQFEILSRTFPKASFDKISINFYYDVDPAHYKKGAITLKIPKNPKTLKKEAFLKQIKRINFSAADLAQLSEADRKRPARYVDQQLFYRLQTKSIHGLRPQEHETVESALLHISKALVNEPAELKKQVFREIINASYLCGTRVYNTIVTQFLVAVMKVPNNYDSRILRALSEHRLMLRDSLVPGNDEQSQHNGQKLMKLIGKDYAIPGWEYLSSFNDVFENEGRQDFDPQQAAERFAELYNPFHILYTAIQPLFEDGDIKSLAMKWHADNKPDHFSGDAEDYVIQEVDAPRSIKKEATIRSLKALQILKDASIAYKTSM